MKYSKHACKINVDYELLNAPLAEMVNGVQMVDLRVLKAKVARIGEVAHWAYRRYRLVRRWNYVLLGVIAVLVCLLIVGCGGGSGGSEVEAAEPSLPSTRTVCVVPGSETLIPHVIQAVDAWNDWDTSPLSETCTAFVRCLPKAVAHEMGHALGILWHPPTGLMAAGTVRGPLMQLTVDDFMALPDDAPTLLYVDEEQPCDHEVGYGYPREPVLSGEVAWYELRTRKIWIEPSPKWRN